MINSTIRHPQKPLAIWLLVILCLGLTGGSCKKKSEQSKTQIGILSQSESLPTETITLADQTFTLELAYTRKARQRGLMFRKELATDRGMLFIFNKARSRSFYMKNCLIDLDIIFLDGQGNIVRMHHMKKPVPGATLETYSSEKPAQYALELPVDTIEKLKLRIGQTVQLPPRIRNIIPEPD